MIHCLVTLVIPFKFYQMFLEVKKTLNYEISPISFQEYNLTQPFSIYMADDDVVGPYSIGFDLSFLKYLHQFYIGSNGWVSFSSGQTISYSPKALTF